MKGEWVASGKIEELIGGERADGGEGEAARARREAVGVGLEQAIGPPEGAAAQLLAKVAHAALGEDVELAEGDGLCWRVDGILDVQRELREEAFLDASQEGHPRERRGVDERPHRRLLLQSGREVREQLEVVALRRQKLGFEVVLAKRHLEFRGQLVVAHESVELLDCLPILVRRRVRAVRDVEQGGDDESPYDPSGEHPEHAEQLLGGVVGRHRNVAVADCARVSKRGQRGKT